ncbi:AraC family transcriptional regulator [Halosquirtibacter xylanolyticus]|uniref:helix-turn-helix domain-containing protein n=1 Tax=Halosquirtibacter xylanolyticus TaxID=3374599 RepID=UPI00374A8F03|nr:AraC family transcriptional regulator [Prolixibacteraceae bacterium]
MLVTYKIVMTKLGYLDCLEEGACDHSHNIYAMIGEGFKFSVIFIYVITSNILVRQRIEQTKGKKIDRMGLQWISSMGMGFLSLLTLVCAIKLFGNYFGSLFIDLTMIVNILITLSVIGLIYLYTRYAFVFAHPFGLVIDNEVKSREDETISEEMVLLYQKLSNIVLEQQYYLDGDLTLRKLASLIGIQEHLISNAINRIGNCSYSDYINKYRISHFISLIQDNKHEEYSLLQLAFECGFNSKSSFNRVFKQFNDVTPTEYIRTYL